MKVLPRPSPHTHVYTWVTQVSYCLCLTEIPGRVDNKILYNLLENCLPVGSRYVRFWSIFVPGCTSEYRLSYQCGIRRKDLDPEDWPIERHETDQSGRELVLLMTEEEIASPPGSDAHRNRTHPTGREDTRAGHQEM